MSTDPNRPEKLTEVEAKGASKTLANRNVLIISTVILIILFAGVFIYFA